LKQITEIDRLIYILTHRIKITKYYQEIELLLLHLIFKYISMRQKDIGIPAILQYTKKIIVYKIIKIHRFVVFL